MISTKGRYALSVMLDLAQQDSEKYIPLEDIAIRQGISKKYLEIILKSLVMNDLLKGVRGKGGGYRLTKKPEEYNVYEILALTEGNMATVACLRANAAPCTKRAQCLTIPMWTHFDELVRDYLGSITLTDILNENIPVLKSN